MPILFILAGTHGSGKTSFYFSAKAHGFIKNDIPFINADIIARDELGGYTAENFERAAIIYHERAEDYINNMQDFIVENNLAGQSDFVWLEKIKEKGYDLVLFYSGTLNITINIKRVEKSVKEGGRFVPESIIRDRYDMSILYLKSNLYLFKEVYLLDNSNETKLVAIVKNGQIDYKENPVPSWVSRLLFLQNKVPSRKE